MKRNLDQFENRVPMVAFLIASSALLISVASLVLAVQRHRASLEEAPLVALKELQRRGQTGTDIRVGGNFFSEYTCSAVIDGKGEFTAHGKSPYKACVHLGVGLGQQGRAK